MYNSNSFAEGYAIGRDSGNGNNGTNNCDWGNSAWWIIILLIFGYGGFGRGFCNNGYGSNGGSGVVDGYVLTSDFANIERKLDGVNNGLCDGFYSVNTSFGNLNNTIAQNTASIQQTITQGFGGINQSLTSQGYETRIAVDGVGRQISDCCCDLKGSIGDAKTQSILNTNAIQQGIQAASTQNAMGINAIQQQISNCCCDIEKMNMQNRYDSAQNQCATLQAIDNLGDRIVNHMNQRDYQNLRDENQALRLAASQAQQNNYLISQLRPTPEPSYIVPNPYTGCCNNVYPVYTNSGCGGNSCC